MSTIQDVDQTLNEFHSVLGRSFAASGPNLAAKLDSAKENLGSLTGELIKRLDSQHQALKQQVSPAQPDVDKMHSDAQTVLAALKVLEKMHGAFGLPPIKASTPSKSSNGVTLVLMVLFLAFVFFAFK